MLYIDSIWHRVCVIFLINTYLIGWLNSRMKLTISTFVWIPGVFVHFVHKVLVTFRLVRSFFSLVHPICVTLT